MATYGLIHAPAPTNFLDSPNDVLLNIFIYVPFRQLLDLSLVNRRINWVMRTRRISLLQRIAQIQFYDATVHEPGVAFMCATSRRLRLNLRSLDLSMLRTLHTDTCIVDRLVEKLATILPDDPFKIRQATSKQLAAGLHSWLGVHERGFTKGSELSQRISFKHLPTQVVALIRLTSIHTIKYLLTKTIPTDQGRWQWALSRPASATALEQLTWDFGFEILNQLVLPDKLSDDHPRRAASALMQATLSMPTVAHTFRMLSRHAFTLEEPQGMQGQDARDLMRFHQPRALTFVLQLHLLHITGLRKTLTRGEILVPDAENGFGAIQRVDINKVARFADRPIDPKEIEMMWLIGYDDSFDWETFIQEKLHNLEGSWLYTNYKQATIRKQGWSFCMASLLVQAQDTIETWKHRYAGMDTLETQWNSVNERQMRRLGWDKLLG